MGVGVAFAFVANAHHADGIMGEPGLREADRDRSGVGVDRVSVCAFVCVVLLFIGLSWIWDGVRCRWRRVHLSCGVLPCAALGHIAFIFVGSRKALGQTACSLAGLRKALGQSGFSLGGLREALGQTAFTLVGLRKALGQTASNLAGLRKALGQTAFSLGGLREALGQTATNLGVLRKAPGEIASGLQLR